MDGRAQAGKTWYLAWLVTTDDLVGVGLIRSKLPEGWPESAGGPPSSSYGLVFPSRTVRFDTVRYSVSERVLFFYVKNYPNID
jgi:hypothetical protein